MQNTILKNVKYPQNKGFNKYAYCLVVDRWPTLFFFKKWVATANAPLIAALLWPLYFCLFWDCTFF
jgi:hypothetical protein